MPAYNDDPNQKRREFYTLTIDNKNEKPPKFVRRKKDEKTSEWYDAEEFKKIEGDLVDVKVESYVDKKGQPRQSIKLTLDDGDAELVIGMGFTNVSRSILNSLAGESTIGHLKFSGDLYTNKETKKIKSVVYVNVRGRERTSWKYSLDQQPKPLETEWKGQILRDYEKVDEFFKEVINKDILPKIAAPKEVKSEMNDYQRHTEPPAVETESGNSNDADDLPF